HYSTFTLQELEMQVKRFAGDLGLEVRFFQTNHEGEFIEYLHRLPDLADGAVLNPGAWTHYSWAIRDALEIAAVPAVEIHISGVTGTSGLALVSAEAAFFSTDFRYVERAARQVSDTLERVQIERGLLPEASKRIHGRVGYDEARTSVKTLRQLTEAVDEDVEL